MIKIEIQPELTIHEASEHLVDLTNKFNDCVSANFNGIMLYVYPGSCPKSVETGWWEESASRKKYYVNCAEAEKLELKALQLRTTQQQENIHNVIIRPNNIISYTKDKPE